MINPKAILVNVEWDYVWELGVIVKIEAHDY